jgi:hypothetical protein
LGDRVSQRSVKMAECASREMVAFRNALMKLKAKQNKKIFLSE